MFSLYYDIATKMGWIAKLIGALIGKYRSLFFPDSSDHFSPVVLVVIVLWGPSDDFSSHSIIASLSVAALGSLAFIGNMFQGTLRRFKAGIDLIEENIFRTGTAFFSKKNLTSFLFHHLTGDEIEIFGRTWGRVRGRVGYIESRFCIVVGRDGKKIYVPTGSPFSMFGARRSAKDFWTFVKRKEITCFQISFLRAVLSTTRGVWRHFSLKRIFTSRIQCNSSEPSRSTLSAANFF